MRHASHPARPTGLERLVAVQVIIFIVGVSWAFGGNADWVRTPISLWGSLGIVLTAVTVAASLRGRALRQALLWMAPVLLLNAVVAVSCLTPGFKELTFEGRLLMMPARVDGWIPSTANARISLGCLWLFDGIYFSCLNIALAVGRRTVIRTIIAAVVGNALILSVFGTAQKLVGSTGIYFGAVKSPQTIFFASFVYDNHWGAFTVLMLGACIGLALRYAYGSKGEGFFRGPAFMGFVAAAMLAISIPFSGSRACTFLLGIMAIVALFKGIPRVSHALRMSGINRLGSSAAIVAAIALFAVGAWFVAGNVMQARVAKTKEQVSTMVAQGGIGSRSILYHDTMRMAHDRRLFGWGMGSFPTVFALYNTQESKIDRIPVVYHDAHSDWLQSLAELGIVGTLLLGAAVALPALSVRPKQASPLPFFLLLGCFLVSAYAWVEFPFGNVAVVLGWWLCFVSAVQYMRLTEHKPHPVPSRDCAPATG